jgi:GT2 family glycosyltransferase
MLNNEIAAVVVTYNRLELLKKVVDGLLNQTRKLNKIIIVNNNSNDGTLKWLNELIKQNSKVEVITQSNTGSSGGQYTGSKYAYEMGYEWIWQMDDDVVPQPNCLEKLLIYANKNICAVPLRINNNNIFYKHDIIKLNLSNPVKSIWKTIFTELEYNKNAQFIEIQGITLEGPIFHRSMFEKVGFVEKNFFIYADDTEYSIRLYKQKVKMGIVKDAIMNRLLPIPENENEWCWKSFYMIRNIIAIDVLHGNLLIRLVRPFGYLISWLFRCRSINHVKIAFNAFIRGYLYKQETLL